MPQESMAKRVNPVATWDNVMLADETLRLLRTLASQARENQSERGGSAGAQGSDSRHGMIAIFTGESDADKAAAAEVLANDLDVKLYRIDLSSVASKWIWETEKNLSRLLSAAEEGDTIYPVLRRSGRPVRQSHLCWRRPQSLHEQRGRFRDAASRDAPRPLDPGDQQAKQPRPGIHPPHPVHRGIRTPPGRRNESESGPLRSRPECRPTTWMCGCWLN